MKEDERTGRRIKDMEEDERLWRWMERIGIRMKV